MGDVVRMDLKNEGIGEPTVYPQEGTKFDSETLDNAFKLFKTMYFRGRNVEDLDHVMVELDSGSEQSVHSQEGIKHEYEELKTAFKRQFLMTERDSLYQRLGDLLAKEKGLWEAPDLPDLYEMKMLQRQLGYTSMRLNEIHTELQVLEMEQGAKSFKEGQRQNDADKKRESIKQRRLSSDPAVVETFWNTISHRKYDEKLKSLQVRLDETGDPKKISVTVNYEGSDNPEDVNISAITACDIKTEFNIIKKYFTDRTAFWRLTAAADGKSFTAVFLGS